jgi:hypothetical protein
LPSGGVWTRAAGASVVGLLVAALKAASAVSSALLRRGGRILLVLVSGHSTRGVVCRLTLAKRKGAVFPRRLSLLALDRLV